MKTCLPVSLLALLPLCALHAQELITHQAWIVEPLDGASVTSPFRVVFGLKPPWGVAPASLEREGTGHHHLIIDAELPDLTKPIPKNDRYHHFGGGQTQTVLKLPPGRHTLQLLLGDHVHMAHKPPVTSPRITIIVEEPLPTPAPESLESADP